MNVVWASMFGEVEFESPNLDYRASLHFYNLSATLPGDKGFQAKTTAAFEIRLDRKSFRYWIETIVPMGILVTISWV